MFECPIKSEEGKDTGLNPAGPSGVRLSLGVILNHVFLSPQRRLTGKSGGPPGPTPGQLFT